GGTAQPGTTNGGAGGVGRVAVSYNTTISGVTSPTYTSSAFVSNPTTTDAVAEGDITRDVNFYEDEDELNPTKITKLNLGMNNNTYAETRITQSDLSNSDFITAWIYSNGEGNTAKLSFGENAATEHEVLINIKSANVWQKVYWDISHIPRQERDAVRILRVSGGSNLYIDNIVAQSFLNVSTDSAIASTPNDYLQYRVILASSNPGYNPTLFNIQAEWSNGFKIQQTDSNNVRLYNYSGTSQDLRLDAVVFGADLAEWYTVDDQTIGAADVVALTGQTDVFGVPILRRANGPDDKGLIGAISTQAGKELGLKADNRRLLGLTGRIPVKIDPASQSISSGDYLTASADKPGYAVKAQPGDMTIAKAFQSWSQSQGEGAILSYIVQPQNAPLVNLTPIGNYLVEKTGDGYYSVRNTADDVLVKPSMALAQAVIGNLTAGRIKTQELEAGKAALAQLETSLISPLAQGGTITITNHSDNNIATPSGFTYETGSDPILIVDGTIDTATISARTARLQELNVDTINAKNIVADSITANSIVGLDAKIASISGELSDQQITTIADRIKARLALLTGSAPTAADLPVPVATESAALVADLSPIATDSAALSSTLASGDLDFVTINEYLAVVGTATITNLNVTNTLNVASIDNQDQSLSLLASGGTINLASNTLLVDSLTGQVAVNGDLTVAGQILADSATLGTLSLGNAKEATSSALGNLLSVYNESGIQVASINASGSASFNELATQIITIASSSDASMSATASALARTLAGTTTSNATAGESILTSPNTELTIKSPYITKDSLVYLTPTGNTDGKVLFVASKKTCDQPKTLFQLACTPSFTVAIDSPASSDISFNWWIIKLQ
ncbi:MAG: hypothetical protein WCG44_03665, partial [bacterium]